LLQQTVELQLPFTNHLLEAARRTYADKHPLAKDKEQAAKLRCDFGRSSDKGERLLDYTISCSNSLVTCPQALVLKAGALGGGSSSAGTAGGAGSRAVSANSVTKRGVSSPAAAAARAAFGSTNGSSGGQQQQGLDGAGKDNVLRLGLKPVGVGIYPARLVLTSPYDVRVVDIEVTAQSLGQSCVLELECPARQQVGMVHETGRGCGGACMRGFFTVMIILTPSLNLRGCRMRAYHAQLIHSVIQVYKQRSATPHTCLYLNVSRNVDSTSCLLPVTAQDDLRHAAFGT
jgi:hypothetical protein